MPFKDPELKKNYRRKWYAKNKESEKAHVKKRKLKIKKWFYEYKNRLSCSNCGEASPATLEFHHKSRNKKENEIGLMVNDGFSILKITEEIKKCEVLCANCHRKLHYKESTNLKSY
jgi:hypothetical protein